MANLTPIAVWSDVYEREPTDFLDASSSGLDNRPNQELLNRTEWLRQALPMGGIHGIISGPQPIFGGASTPSLNFNPSGGDYLLAFSLGWATEGEIMLQVRTSQQPDLSVAPLADATYKTYLQINPVNNNLSLGAALAVTYAYTAPTPTDGNLWRNLDTGLWSVGNGAAWVVTNPCIIIGEVTASSGQVDSFRAYPFRVSHWQDTTPGLIIASGGSHKPSGGYLACNGQAVSRTVFSRLFGEIGVLYGVGNGTTTFNVPDLRGEFLRGVDGGRGIDSGRVLGSAQPDQVGSHLHAIKLHEDAGSAGAIMASGGATPATPDGATALSGGTETRPRNVAVAYWIKY